MRIDNTLTNSIQNNFNDLNNIVKDFNQNQTNVPLENSNANSPQKMKQNSAELVGKVIAIKNHTAADIATLKATNNMKGSLLSLLA